MGIASCSSTLDASPVTAAASNTQAATELPLETAIPETPTPQIHDDLCFDESVPSGLIAKTISSDAIQPCTEHNTAFHLKVGDQNPVSQWIYAVAAPFFTIDDDISADMLKSAWTTGSQSGLMISKLMVDQNTYAVLSAFWGNPNPDFVLVLTPDEMAANTGENPTYWAILPFENIEPTWKIITVDDQSPLRKDFSAPDYALTVPISLLDQQDKPGQTADLLSSVKVPVSNRDPNKLTTVLMTGVTALVRATANTMEKRGMTYPADQIRPWFLEADIVHISNEISYTPTCPEPYPCTNDLVFCSQPEYNELLESISTDVVELSGDHFQDYGPDATLYTIQMYKDLGWQYYGGGVNLADGQKPALFDVNGNKIAFLGCNGKGGGYAGATDTNPGAVPCDFDYMTKEIKLLRDEGYLPIVTFQHLEYYSYEAHPILVHDFREVAAAGAVIVSGSQAHQPHAMEFYDGAFLHYGLGNLFFDQLFESKETGQAFIDRHVFYDGKYIGTELLTIQFVDLAQSRPMTLEERQILLYTVFQASKNIKTEESK